MLDVVVVAMLLIVPVMWWSIGQVKHHQRYGLHKTVQLILAGLLLVTVVIFEIDIQYVTPWRPLAEKSPYYESLVFPSLIVHLLCSVPTAFIWIYVVYHGLRYIPDPPAPSVYSGRHIWWGKIAAIEMTLTAVTGWIFYYLAFVA